MVTATEYQNWIGQYPFIHHIVTGMWGPEFPIEEIDDISLREGEEELLEAKGISDVHALAWSNHIRYSAVWKEGENWRIKVLKSSVSDSDSRGRSSFHSAPTIGEQLVDLSLNPYFIVKVVSNFDGENQSERRMTIYAMGDLAQGRESLKKIVRERVIPTLSKEERDLFLVWAPELPRLFKEVIQEKRAGEDF